MSLCSRLLLFRVSWPRFWKTQAFFYPQLSDASTVCFCWELNFLCSTWQVSEASWVGLFSKNSWGFGPIWQYNYTNNTKFVLHLSLSKALCLSKARNNMLNKYIDTSSEKEAIMLFIHTTWIPDLFIYLFFFFLFFFFFQIFLKKLRVLLLPRKSQLSMWTLPAPDDLVASKGYSLYKIRQSGHLLPHLYLMMSKGWPFKLQSFSSH